jgi:hypothetical protein
LAPAARAGELVGARRTAQREGAEQEDEEEAAGRDGGCDP